jgi:heat-inducible transcriptional repressor
MVEPEFADSEQLMGVVSILEHGHGLLPIIDRLPLSGVQVIIGGEPPLESIPHVTLVLSRFGQHSTPHGVLGVLGPTRLSYERAVSTVGFVAELMTNLVAGGASATA